MDDPLILPTVSATRNRLAELMTSIGQGAGKAVDWLAGGAQVGAEPTVALMRGDALDQPFLPTADSGGRLGAIASAVTAPLVPGSAPAGALGVYGGRLAKTANLPKLADAEQMAAAGANSEAIRTATGWFQGPEGKWRFEIPDDTASLTRAPGVAGDTVGDILRHPDLMAAYPDMARTKVRGDNLGAHRGEFYQGSMGPRVALNTQTLRTPEELKSTLLHELQHAVQDREGFAPGGNEGAVNGMVTAAERRIADLRGQAQSRFWEVGTVDEPGMQALKQQIDAAEAELAHLGTGGFDGYQRLAGEVEARDVQARMNMPNSQRAATAPYSSQGIPPEQMILRGVDPATQAAQAAWIQEHLARGGM